MKTPFIKSVHYVIACALLACFSAMSHASELSDSSNGDLAISGPLTLVVPETKIFNFTTFSIFADGILDFSGATSTDNIQIRATGDVLIDGILNAMPSMLTITTPGSITINGTINFGDALTLSASTISINGTTDGNFETIERTNSSITLQSKDYSRYPLTDGTSGAITISVPEPETYSLLMTGLYMIGFIVRRRKAYKF